MTIDVNYKNKRRYKTAKYPMHQNIFWTGLIWILSRFALIGKKKQSREDWHGGSETALYAAEQPYAFH